MPFDEALFSRSNTSRHVNEYREIVKAYRSLSPEEQAQVDAEVEKMLEGGDDAEQEISKAVEGEEGGDPTLYDRVNVTKHLMGRHEQDKHAPTNNDGTRMHSRSQHQTGAGLREGVKTFGRDGAMGGALAGLLIGGGLSLAGAKAKGMRGAGSPNPLARGLDAVGDAAKTGAVGAAGGGVAGAALTTPMAALFGAKDGASTSDEKLARLRASLGTSSNPMTNDNLIEQLKPDPNDLLSSRKRERRGQGLDQLERMQGNGQTNPLIEEIWGNYLNG